MVGFAMRVSWVATAALVASIAGCSSSTPGQPSASDGADPGTTEETSTPPSSGPEEEPNFSKEDLCEFLTSDEATTLGASPTGEPGNSVKDGSPQCTWTDATSLVVGFQTGGEFVPPTGPEITNTDITVAGVPATLSKQVTSVRTNCQVLVKVGKDSMVSTLAGLHDAGKGKYEECDLATKFANIVLPKVLEK